jgi:antitoxin (DNA-binding transcriptional repressor) of toxin-antitoxin stability system
MADVSIRELRQRGGVVVDRAARGEHITITRGGKAVAELRAVPNASLSAQALLAKRRLLPAVDANALRADIGQILDTSL